MEEKIKNEDIVWLTNREFINLCKHKIVKILYYLGIIKPLRWKEEVCKRHSYYRPESDGKLPKQIYSFPQYIMTFGYRWWNPLALVFFLGLTIICLLVKGISGLKEELKDKDYNIELYVQKVLYTRDGRKVYDYERSA